MRIPVVDHKNKPLMPTTPSRARRWVKEGKALKRWSKLGTFYVQLVVPPSGRDKQDVSLGLDPGKLYSGVAVQSAKCTLLMLHLELPFKIVKARMEQRAMMRRTRRGRRINRKIAFNKRAHRQKRFDNRRNRKLPPSIGANKKLELRVIRLLTELYPISHIVVEQVKAKGNKGFSPAMVGQMWQLEQLVNAEKFLSFKVSTKYGWETSQLRQHLGLLDTLSTKVTEIL
jgi:RRXRR protein